MKSLCMLCLTMLMLGISGNVNPNPPVLDQSNFQIHKSDSFWTMHSGFTLQQRVTCIVEGVVHSVAVNLGEGRYSVKVFPGKPWIHNSSIDIITYPIVVAERGWVFIDTKLIPVFVGDYITIEVRGVGRVYDTAYYNIPSGYTYPFDGYVDGEEWGFSTKWKNPGILGCHNRGESFDMLFMVYIVPAK